MTRSTLILLLYADALSAPEVAWSLHDAGIGVIAAVRRGTRPALCRSRLIDVVELADPAISAGQASDELGKWLAAHPDVTTMPLDDHAILIVRRLGPAATRRVCGAEGAAADVVLDKHRQIVAARDAGFAVPETVLLTARDDVARIASFPCIVKPARAARVIDDRVGRGRSVLLADACAARRFRDTWDVDEPMLAQPHLEGVGEGLFGLALDRGVVAWSAHRRVRMMNPAGSGSSACTNVFAEPEARAIAERFLRGLGWRGLFMIEFLRDANGTPWFMELNGRPWGSMALARRLGLDYPAWSVSAMLDPTFIPVEPDIKESIVCRHWGREVMHLLFVIRGPGPDGSRERWPRIGTALRDLSRYTRGQAAYNWRPDDPLVFWADVVDTVSSQIRIGHRLRLRWTLFATRIRRRAHAWGERRRQRLLRRTRAPASFLVDVKSMLFVCHGNINRSALAETHLSQLIDAELSIRSCGFHREAGRAADVHMVDLAREKDIRLDRWSSRTIDPSLVESADVIFAMEADHLVRLYAEYPDCRGKAFLLSCITPPGSIPLEIEDPFGGSRSAYQRCLDEVTSATSALAALIARRGGAAA